MPEGLLLVVDLSWATSIVDPWSGSRMIVQVLGEHGYVVQTSDICRGYVADSLCDALQSGFYQLARRESKLGAIVVARGSKWLI